jgi:hypothetical protein
MNQSVNRFAPVLLLTAVICFSACNRGPTANQNTGPIAKTETCGQTTMTGSAGTKEYDTEAACVEDRANQQAAAEKDGIAKCEKYCTGLGADCKPQPAPKPPKATPACKKLENGKWQSTVETGPFDCICKK